MHIYLCIDVISYNTRNYMWSAGRWSVSGGIWQAEAKAKYIPGEDIVVLLVWNLKLEIYCHLKEGEKKHPFDGY